MKLTIIPDEGAREATSGIDAIARLYSAWRTELREWGNLEMDAENHQIGMSMQTTAQRLIMALTTELAEARRERDETTKRCEVQSQAMSSAVVYLDALNGAMYECLACGAPKLDEGHREGCSLVQARDALANWEPTDTQAQLDRANAVIERVVALEAPEEPSVDDENADDLTYDMECFAWAKGYARALETVRRTILEGNGA